MITSLEQLDLTKAYTFKDYLSWRFQERVELLRGYIAKMSPAPTSTHQIISSNLHYNLGYFLQKKSCKVIAAPFDVYLPSIKGEGETVVQPDLCVICDKTKIKKQGCVGSPDLVIEILSLGNSRREMTQKFQIYEQAGVREYWVVYPYEQVVHQYILEREKFQALPVAEKTIVSQILQGFEVDLDTIFDTIVE